jgi:hypothetical protein
MADRHAVGREAATVTLIGNDCGATVVQLAPPDAGLSFWDSQVAHSILDVSFATSAHSRADRMARSAGLTGMGRKRAEVGVPITGSRPWCRTA